MYRLISRFNGALAEVCGIGLILMVLFLIVELATRLAGVPVHGGAILAVFVMVTAIYFGLATCEQRLKHIRMDAVLPLLPPKARRAIGIFNYVLLIGLYACVVFGVTESAFEAFVVQEAEPVGTQTVPIWPVKTGMALGLFCYWLQLLANFYQMIRVGKIEPAVAGEGSQPATLS